MVTIVSNMLISLIMVNIHSVFGCQKVKLYILNMYNFYLSIISYKAGKNPKFHDFFNTSALFFIFFNAFALLLLLLLLF